MRTKKALKQLSKAEALIRAVAERYTPKEPQLQELLDSASATIVQAKGVFDNRSGQPPRALVQATGKRSQTNESETPATPEFTGNKSDFVRALVEVRGPSGTTAREIDEAFTIRHIDRSKNFIYSVLSALAKQKKIKKQGDRYFATSPDLNAKPGSTKKRISPEGLKRTIEGNKRRWVQQKASHTKAARPKSDVGNKSTLTHKPVGRKASVKRAAAKTRV